MEQGSLYTHIENGIAIVEFYHPAANSLPGHLLERIIKAFEKLSADKEARVIVLKSEKEGTFCAGASLDELLSINNLTDGIAFFSGFGKLINAMRKCPQPIIGRVQGHAVGGGIGLIAACDYAMVTEKAFIKLSEISIGIGPFVVEPVIRRKIGTAAFSELALDSNHWQNAYWAKNKGLYAQVFDTTTELDKEIQVLAERLASYAPQAVQHLKQILWEGTEHWDTLLDERAEICGKLILSDVTKKALERFRRK